MGSMFLLLMKGVNKNMENERQEVEQMKTSLRITFYIFWAIYVYASWFVILLTWQMLNPTELIYFLISFFIAVFYTPVLAVFCLLTWLFFCSLRKHFSQSRYWSKIRLLPIVPFIVIVLQWIYVLIW